MAVFTKLAREDIQTILRNYDLGELRDFQEISEGTENSNFLLDNTSGKYILTIFEKRVNRQDLPFFLELMAYLPAQNFAAPKIYSTVQNSLFFNFNAKTGVIIDFVAGRPTNLITNEQLSEFGKQIAKLHLTCKNFPKKRSNEFSVLGINKLYQKLKLQRHFDEQQVQFIGRIIEQLNQADFNYLPQGIIHADLFPDNVFFQDGKFSALIDFYFACYDYLIFDLAIAIVAWCFTTDKEFSLEQINNLISGYETQRALETQERAQLKNFCLLAGLRFYLTRLDDYFYHKHKNLYKPKDPGDFYERLVALEQVAL